MSTDSHDLDYEQALLDPAGTFDVPDMVVDDPRLSRAQKIEILRRWQYDANELEVATEEGMGGGEESMVGRVAQALDRLEAGEQGEADAPHKQRGS